MPGKMLAMVASLVVFGLAGAAKAIPVDLQLSLVIDDSSSISNNEFSQQIDGYANAFRQTAVVDSIVNSPNGVAVNTILFASGANEVIQFRQLQTAQQVEDFADALAAITRAGGATNIAAGIDLAVATIASNGFESGNIIIDVSGDGQQNVTGNAAASRDAALIAGISRVNGIAIGGQNIFDFYAANVAGGTDSFVLQANSFDEFETAIATKIGIEVGAPDPIGVPEPGVISMLGLGFLVFGFAMRRRNNS